MFLSLAEAAALIRDSSVIAFGGMTVYRRPLAFALELLRRTTPPRDLTLMCFTAGLESDILVGAGCVSKVRSVYFGLESFGFAPMFTEKANKGEIQIIEETEASIVMGLRAQVAGVGFMPSQAWIGTDLLQLRPDVKTIIEPYSGETLTAFPAIPVDVAVIHALEADSQGNVKINTNLGIDLELVYAADRVIITAERLVEQVEKSVEGVIIPAPGADVIVHAPRGAYPTSCYPDYPLAGGVFLDYIEACNAGQFEVWLANFK